MHGKFLIFSIDPVNFIRLALSLNMNMNSE